MDKRSMLAMMIIMGIIVAYMLFEQSYYKAPLPEDNAQANNTEQVADQQNSATTSSDQLADVEPIDAISGNTAVITDSAAAIMKYGKYFAPASQGWEGFVIIETDLVKAVISRKGAVIKKWYLNKYKNWTRQYDAQLISDPKGELSLDFVSIEGKKIDTRDLYFDMDNEKYHYVLSGSDSLVLKARLQVAKGRYIEKRFVFFGDQYIVNTDITFANMDPFILTNRGYNFNWTDGIRYQEENSVDESSQANAMAMLNGEKFDIEATDAEEPVNDHPDGTIDYVSTRTKYFGAAIIPQPFHSFRGQVSLDGKMEVMPNAGQRRIYDISFQIPYDGGVATKSYKVFIGPLDYDIVDDYGLSEMVYFGWGPLRFIGEYMLMPLFGFIHMFVPNYGFTILIFSFLIKMILYPLSVKQLRSTGKMKLLQPEINKIREKYKDDNKKQQKETMALYSKYGVKPAGGCLPLLLQMPILFSLWAVLRSAIDLRQADFMWWMTDLSAPDGIIPFIGIMGIDELSGLAVAMGITMFIQQKMTITDPKQKAMVYMMPFMFVFMFSGFPSGLNLYYFMFNLMGILQQVYINKFSRTKPNLQQMKASPKKEGFFAKKMREAQDMAESQGKSIPGQKSSGKNNYPNRRKKKK